MQCPPRARGGCPLAQNCLEAASRHVFPFKLTATSTRTRSVGPAPLLEHSGATTWATRSRVDTACVWLTWGPTGEEGRQDAG